jgi:hypothetical protein
VKKKIPMRHIFNKSAEERITMLNKMHYTEARYLPAAFESKISTDICGDRVVLIFWEHPISAVVIDNSSIAKTYKNYFEILWKHAKKLA